MAYIKRSFNPASAEMKGAEGVKMQVLIGADEGAPNFVMRRFLVAPGGHSPRHQHDYEHVVYILAGSGTLFASNQEFDLEAGFSLLVSPDEEHQFLADKGEELEFLCTIPRVE